VLAEDLGRAGDVTSIATIPEDATAHAIVVARKAGVIAGLPLVAGRLRKLAPRSRSPLMRAMARASPPRLR